METFQEKAQENTNKAISYQRNGKQREKSIAALPDHRPQSIVQKKQVEALKRYKTNINDASTIQCARLRDRKFIKPDQKEGFKIYRALNRAGRKRSWPKRSKRNVMVARFTSEDGKKRYNLVLRSAGMGGTHPIGAGKRSAAHTEPQLAALLNNPSFRKKLNRRLGKKWKVVSVFSSNQPCSSAGGGSAEGCGGMDDSELGSPPRLLTTSAGSFVGGHGPTFGNVLHDLGGDDADETSSVGSHDSHLADEDVRGKDLEQLSFEE